MKGFGKRLKEERNKKRITQVELAKITGISQPTIFRYEKEKGEPRKSDIDKIASALGISVSVLMCETASLADFEVEFPDLLCVDIVDKKARCGCGNKYEDFGFNVIGTRLAIDSELKAVYGGDTLLSLIAEGDSMQPDINDGDIVWFKFDPFDWSFGNQVVVCYQNTMFVRGIIGGSNDIFPVILRSRHPAEYPDIIVKEGEPFNIIGRVLRILSSKKPAPVI